MPGRDRISVPVILLATAVGWGVAACGSDVATAPSATSRTAFGKGGGTAGVTVSALDPDTVPSDTTLVIRVLGSGFSAGDKVTWLLAGSATTKVTTTGPVTFVSSKELRATVTVAPDAQLTRYDVEVATTGGKKGIGVEMLDVVANMVLLPEPGWAVSSNAWLVTGTGVIYGRASSSAGGQSELRWVPSGGSWAVEELGVSGASFLNHANDDGYLVGITSGGAGLPDRYWVRTPTGTEIAFPAGQAPYRIGRSGTLIGYVANAGGTRSPAAWRREGAAWGPPIILPVTASWTNAWLNGINDRDDIAGRAEQGSTGQRPVVWRFDGVGWTTMTVVDTDAGSALRIGSSGIAGEHWPCLDSSGSACGSVAAFWAAPGAPRRLLAKVTNGGQTGIGGMNNANQIVGWAEVPSGRRGALGKHAMVWYSPGDPAPYDLGTLRSGWYSQAVGVNEHGVVVGFGIESSRKRAVVWRLP